MTRIQLSSFLRSSFLHSSFLLSSFLLSSFLLSARLADALLSPDAAAPCDCFKTSTSHTFTNRALYDFRGQSQYAGRPPLIGDPDAASSAPNTSDYFSSEQWTSAWNIQTWSRKKTNTTILMVNSANNVYIDGSGVGTYLVLRTARNESGVQTAGEFQSVTTDFQFLSARMYARTVGSSGACGAMFTYLNSDPVQEADIEFLTMDASNIVHYTNQPTTDDNQNRSTCKVAMPVRRSDWAEHRIEWTDGQTQWFINGKSTGTMSFQAPKDPSMINFNAWSNGGSFTGLMPKGGEARLEIQWIDVAYNRSSTAGSSTCSNVCDMD